MIIIYPRFSNGVTALLEIFANANLHKAFLYAIKPLSFSCKNVHFFPLFFRSHDEENALENLKIYFKCIITEQIMCLVYLLVFQE